MPETTDTAAFIDIKRVIADPLRFKQRLRIGEDAYALMRVKKTVQQWWEVAGAAWGGAGVAASSTVANTFFASTASGGILSWIGLGTAAATPMGWVIAAAVVSGGAYWGVMRLFGRGGDGAFVDTIPKFINTPLDLLGASLLDLMGALALRIAAIDGHVDPAERAVIRDHFIRDWGYEPAYVDQALAVIEAGADAARVKTIALALADFQSANRDCNAAAMQAELVALLREVAEADGVLDEREELAIEAVERLFQEQHELSLRNVRRSLSSAAGTVNDAASVAAGKAGNIARGMADRLREASISSRKPA